MPRLAHSAVCSTILLTLTGSAVTYGHSGCFAVQQTDTQPNVNTPANINTQEELEDINKEVASNQAALPAAVEANQNAGSTEAEQNLAAVNAILGLTTTLADFPTQTPTVQFGGASEATATAAAGAGGNGAVVGGNQDAGNQNAGNQRGGRNRAGNAASGGNTVNTGAGNANSNANGNAAGIGAGANTAAGNGASNTNNDAAGAVGGNANANAAGNSNGIGAGNGRGGGN